MARASIQIPAVIAKAVEPVGSLAAELIGSVIAGRHQLGALPSPTQLSGEDEQVIAELAFRIESRAAVVCAKLLKNPKFLKNPTLGRELVRQLAANRVRTRTGPIEKVVANHLSSSTKEITRRLEEEGVLRPRGVYYEYVATGKRFKASTLPSKISRIRIALASKKSTESLHNT